MRKIVLLMMAVLLIMGVVRCEVKNLLVNGDFEEGRDGDVPGWTRSFYPEREGISECVHRSKTRAKLGHWSLQIDTQPVLGEEVILVYNGAVVPETTHLRGQRLVLSGWVYVEPGTALRPMGMRLRTFGKDKEGKGIFLGDVLEVKVLGKPGKWVPFSESGLVPDKEITGMDLHCGIAPDTVRTVQFLDDLRLQLLVPPPLELRLLRNAVWRDETTLAVEVDVNQAIEGAETLSFRLLTLRGKVVTQWSKPARAGIVGLPLPKGRLAEGTYLLCAELRDNKGKVLASAKAPLEVAKSPWEGAPKRRHKTAKTHPEGNVPPGFRVMGTVAPTEAPDAIPPQPEMTSADVDLSPWRNRGYVVFSRHYLDGVSRLGRPRPGEIGPVKLFACPGEYEPATISVWAMQALNGLRLIISDLVSENGTIAASNVEVRVVRTVRGLPAFLEKRQAVDIPEGETQTFWLTLYVPPNTPPGFYYGDIEIAPSRGKPTQVELVVRVLPLKLPPPPKGYGFWWKMDSRWNGYYSKERKQTLEQIRKQFIFLREHGCNMVSCYGMPKMTKKDTGITFNFERDHWGHDLYSLGDFFRLGRETGLFSPRVPLQYPGAESLHSDWIARFVQLDRDSAAFADFYRDVCRRIDRWAKEQGFTLAFACVDEIGNSPERRQDALRFYRLAQEAGTLTSVTDNSMHAGVHLMGQSRFDDIIAMRLYNFITPEMIENARRSNDRLWLYNMGSGGWDAKHDRFVFGLFTERCGAEGHSQWAFQWPPGIVSPYEAAAAGQHSGYHYALPAPDGPLPTLALEGVREGIDDARYLSLVPPRSQVQFLADIEPLSTSLSRHLERWTGNTFDIRRWQIARRAIAERSRTKRRH